MRCLLIPALLTVHALCAQRLDPDQQPYWSRYTFVEDSSVLTPLAGTYHVYYIQAGQHWSYSPAQYPVVPQAEDELRMRPLFDAPLPTFTATPARGKDSPDVKVVVVRGLDTMVVELSVYYPPMPAYERPTIREGERRPPVVLPFRTGRFLPTGVRYGKDYYGAEEGSSTVDARTVDLTKQFDALWKKAMNEERVIPQWNTDTCHQEVQVPAGLQLPETKYRDVWVLRSPYCGKRVTDMSGKPASEERVRTWSVGRTPRLCEGARPNELHALPQPWHGHQLSPRCLKALTSDHGCQSTSPIGVQHRVEAEGLQRFPDRERWAGHARVQP